VEQKPLKKFDIYAQGLPPEMLAFMKDVPPRGTPEHAKWVDDQITEARKHIRPFTTDELLKAMERERAGYNGLGELWGCVPTSTQT
jgi:hypothetical protein